VKSRAIAVKATVTDYGDSTVLKVDDQDVRKALTESLIQEAAQTIDEKKLRDDVRATLRKAMVQLSLPVFIPGHDKSDELSTVLSLLKVLKPIEMWDAENSTVLGQPMDMKL